MTLREMFATFPKVLLGGSVLAVYAGMGFEHRPLVVTGLICAGLGAAAWVASALLSVRARAYDEETQS